MSPIPYTTPRTWTDTELVTAAMLNEQVRDNENAAFPLGVDAWTAYTPTLTQSATVTKTVTYARYQRVGRMVTASVMLAVTGAGTAANSVLVGLPVTAVQGGNLCVGAGYIYDSSATSTYKGLALVSGTTTVAFAPSNTTTPGFLGGDTFTAALASGDVVTFTVTYEAVT